MPAEFAQEIARLQQETMAAVQAGNFGKVEELAAQMKKAKAAGEAATKKRKAEDAAANEELDQLEKQRVLSWRPRRR